MTDDSAQSGGQAPSEEEVYAATVGLTRETYAPALEAREEVKS